MMTKKHAMKVAANACDCGHINMPAIGGPDPANKGSWLFGYVCERCGRMGMSGMIGWAFEGWTEKQAQSLVRASRKVYKVKA